MVTTDQAYALQLIRHQCEQSGIGPGIMHQSEEAHPPEALAQAAAYYALPHRVRAEVDYGLFKTTLRHTLWPFTDACRADDRLQDLAKAGQLIVAEIARLWLLRHESLVDVVPVNLPDQGNWCAWQAAFLAAGRADGYSEEVLAATDWDRVRQAQFSQGVRALTAYRCYYDDPTDQFLQQYRDPPSL